MTIPVFMTTDENYILQAYVAIYSLCEHVSCNNHVELIMLCDSSLPCKCRQRLKKIEGEFSNIAIVFYEIERSKFKYASSDYYVPVATFYRLICAEASDYEKAIFLDSDIIVDLDISELYGIDLEENYLAGVRDMYPIQFPNFARDYARDYNIADFSDYINCGIMLMNLEKIRVDGLEELFILGMRDKNKFVDQDILNRVCHGHIMLLPWKYNIAQRNTEEEFYIFLGEDRGGDGEIVHYCGPQKPWNNRNCYMGDRWWNVAKKALEQDEYERLFNKVNACFGNDQLFILANKCKKKGCTVIIVGYSDHGQFIRSILRKYGIKNDIIFCDNDAKKRGLHLGRDEVHTVEEMADMYRDAEWLNVVQNMRSEIYDQLISLGISEDHIDHYYFMGGLEQFYGRG